MTLPGSVPLVALAFLAGPALARGQLLNPQPSRQSAPSASTVPVVTRTLDAAVAQSLATNPVTAPYRIGVESRNGKLVLHGRVGSSFVHDAAVRTAIGLGASVSDELVIDTTGAYPLNPPPNGPGYPGGPGGMAYGGAPRADIVTSYTYPPPLFGRYDEPFFGLEPPLSSFPAWWGDMSRVRLAQNAPAPTAASQPANLAPNTVEATIDPLGVALLRGTVPSIEDKAGIEQRISQTPGVSRVINRIDVDTRLAANVAAAPQARTLDDQPPPPPTPSASKPAPDPAGPTGQPIRPAAPELVPRPAEPAAAAPRTGVLGRVDRAIRDRPELAGAGIKVSVRDGVAYLSGKVPTILEAMLAFRAVQQTPGVRSLVDSLEFQVPDGTARNPLLRANPEDVEPYLEAQIRRQVGDTAHLDRVRLQGDTLQVNGTLERSDDRPRVEAILRSMPVLRGLKIQPEFRAVDR
jgi:osmotically-inducible protein OsmY